jgi:hypothetical protein
MTVTRTFRGWAIQRWYGVPEVTMRQVYYGDFEVPESSDAVETGVDVEPLDRLVFRASGEIWAGVVFTGANGPGGWHYRDSGRKFPLPGGNPYSLLGRIAGRYFQIGSGLERIYTGAGAERLFLRTNDDSPGNGAGAFTCNVELWRRV